MNTIRILSAAALLSSLLLAWTTVPASSLGQAVSVELGSWISAQGNLALRDIEDSLRRELRERLQPLPLPTSDRREPAEQPVGDDAASSPRD